MSICLSQLRSGGAFRHAIRILVEGTEMNNTIILRKVLKNLGRRQLTALILSFLLTGAAILFIGYSFYRSTKAELELRGEMDVIQSAERFNAYLSYDRNALIVAGYKVNSLLMKNAPAEDILRYLEAQTEDVTNAIDESFTGLYGWIGGEYLDGAGWVPDEGYVPTERPWYLAAAAHPHQIVFVDPYVDQQTGKVMITIAELLDDGESVIALDIGLDGLQQITNEIAADTPGTVVMVLDSGEVAIAHSDAEEVGRDYKAIVRSIDKNDQYLLDAARFGEGIRILKQEVIGLFSLIPLAEHRDLIAHEIQLLSRMHHHIEIQRPALRELHIVVTEDLVDDRLLTVDDLVMGKRKQMPLVVEIKH